MDEYINSEEEIRIYNEIQEKQAVLDKGWNKPRHQQKYINGFPVSDEEYYDYLEKRRIEDANRDAEIDFYKRCTSTGEEWETDSDGDFTPDWLYDKI